MFLSIAGLLVLGPCLGTGPPAAHVVQEQLELVNRSLELLHEEVAAARAPSYLAILFLVLAILAMLGAGLWLVWRAERSVVDHDVVMRTLIRSGFSDRMIQAYVDESTKPQLPCELDRTVELPGRPD